MALTAMGALSAWTPLNLSRGLRSRINMRATSSAGVAADPPQRSIA
jgi:hypothetical protein